MPHALIIDDDSDVSASLTALVIEEGFTAATAASLTEAREQMRTPPDIILLDLVLPDGNGIDLLKAVRQNGAGDCGAIRSHVDLGCPLTAVFREILRPLACELHGMSGPAVF